MRSGMAALALMMLFALGTYAHADEPPAWAEFNVVSASGRYVAEVRARESPPTKSRDMLEYVLTVYEAGTPRGAPLWSCGFDYDGYSGGVLSEDGTTFSVVSFWYYDDSWVVQIYRDGKKTASIRGREFGISKRHIEPTVSHSVWLMDGVSQRYVEDEEGRLLLEITTRDGRTRLVDVLRGKVVR